MVKSPFWWVEITILMGWRRSLAVSFLRFVENLGRSRDLGIQPRWWSLHLREAGGLNAPLRMRVGPQNNRTVLEHTLAHFSTISDYPGKFTISDYLGELIFFCGLQHVGCCNIWWISSMQSRWGYHLYLESGVGKTWMVTAHESRGCTQKQAFTAICRIPKGRWSCPKIRDPRSNLLLGISTSGWIPFSWNRFQTCWPQYCKGEPFPPVQITTCDAPTIWTSEKIRGRSMEIQHLLMVMLRACFCIPCTEVFFPFHGAKSGCEGWDDCGRYLILHPSFHHFRVSASVTGGVRERGDWTEE